MPRLPPRASTRAAARTHGVPSPAHQPPPAPRARPRRFIPGLVEGLLGAKAGEQRLVPVQFPTRSQQADLSGKPLLFDVQVRPLLFLSCSNMCMCASVPRASRLCPTRRCIRFASVLHICRCSLHVHVCMCASVHSHRVLPCALSGRSCVHVCAHLRLSLALCSPSQTCTAPSCSHTPKPKLRARPATTRARAGEGGAAESRAGAGRRLRGVDPAGPHARRTRPESPGGRAGGGGQGGARADAQLARGDARLAARARSFGAGPAHHRARAQALGGGALRRAQQAGAASKP